MTFHTTFETSTSLKLMRSSTHSMQQPQQSVKATPPPAVDTDEASSSLNRTQVAARHPTTNHVVRIANSKIVRTAGSEAMVANLVPITLCADFLAGLCSKAQSCPHLHALGMSKKGWPLIVVDEDPTLDGIKRHEAGWTVPAYDASMSYLAEVPSEHVVQTRGSIKYALQFNEHGPTGRYRFQLCARYRANRCPEGGNCSMIHTHADVRALSRSSVHVNTVIDDASCSKYPTLPAGLTLRVCDPNLRTHFTDVLSEHVLCTQGSEAFYENPKACTRRLQHCAHFYLKKMCNRGPECTFLHVLSLRTQHRRDSPASAASISPTRSDASADSAQNNGAPLQAPLQAPRPLDMDDAFFGLVTSMSVQRPSISESASTSATAITPEETPVTTSRTHTPPLAIRAYRHDPYLVSSNDGRVWIL